jgi:hypothetical protein
VLIAAGGGSALVASAAPSSPSSSVATSPRPQASLTDATAQPAGAFIAVSPLRVLDTRPAPYGPIGVTQAAKLGPNSKMDLRLAGNGFAVPANATAVQLNITISEDATQGSFLTVWPTGETQPNASSNNALPGLIASNSMLAKLGTNGSISIYNQQGSVNVIIDLVGYLVPMPPAAPDGAASAYSTATATLTPTGTTAAPIAFSTAGPASGSVTRKDATTFTARDNALYSVTYDAEFTGPAVAGTVSVFVNGVATGPAVPVAPSSPSVRDDVLVAVPAAGTIDVRFTPTAPGGTLTISSSSIVVTEAANAAPTS